MDHNYNPEDTELIFRMATILDNHEKSFQKKDSALAAQARQEGNRLYTQQSHNQKTHRLILLYYTKSVALAVENSEEQALAYSNRSALLMHLHKYKKCLIDINRAFKITQSEDLKKKLQLRKEKCLEQIKNKDDKFSKNSKDLQNLERLQDAAFYTRFMTKEFGHVYSEGILKTLRRQNNLPETGSLDDYLDMFDKSKIPKLESQNDTIPSFLKHLVLKYNKEFGRHVLATRDIKPGEILTVEKGFVIPRVNHIYVACSYCLNFSWNGIPCPHCVFAIYCSEKCKTKAWEEYHDIECSIMPPFFSEMFGNIGNLSHEMLALRLFITFVKNEGLQNIIDQAEAIDKDKNAHINGFLSNGKFDNRKFRSVYNLLNHEQDMQQKSNQEFGHMAILMLSRYTKIFDAYDSKNVGNLKKQARNLIIKINSKIHVNSYSFSDSSCRCTSANDCIRNCINNLGIIIAPSSCLFNHSCTPNVSQIVSKGGRRMLYCTRPIKKDEQLCLSYGPVANNDFKQKRQMHLKTYYKFTCNCEACKNNWQENPEHRDRDYDPKIVSQIDAEVMQKFSKGTGMKKFKYVSNVINYIELSYKYFDKCEANRFNGQHINYLEGFIHKMYGVELKIPKTC